MNKNQWNITWGERLRELPAEPFTGKHLIANEWRASLDGATMTSFSPAHKVLVGVYAKGSEQEVDLAFRSANEAFTEGPWRFMPAKERAGFLLRVGDLIAKNGDEIAYYESLESGKPLLQAKDEIAIAVDLWHYAAGLARLASGSSYNNLGERTLGMTIREPVGVVGMIMPWNFPFLIISQKLPFALAAGCCCVIKPSELTCATTVILAELLLQADMPAGVVNLVLGEGEPVGRALVAHPLSSMSSFTGSTQVGALTAAAAGANLKKVSLELGGKNPQVILPDCDWDAMIDSVVFGMCFNAGECCNSGSRALVHQEVVDRFITDVSSLAARVPLGDPLHSGTKMGAIISTEQYHKIAGYVDTAVKEGGELVLGGERLDIADTDGLFYPPTLVVRVDPAMAIAKEEVFGPVLAVIPFKNEEEMLSLANSCSYGLSAGIWSNNIASCINFARKVAAGTVWINGWMDGFAELPFGGVKQSGLGRELGKYGMEEFTEIKTIQLHTKLGGKWLAKAGQ